MRRIALVLLVACSGGHATPPTTPAPPTTTPDAAGPAPALTTAQCEALVMHITELTVAEEGSAAETGDRDKVRAALQSFVVECTALPPEVYRCALAAKTTAEVTACEPRSSHDAQ